jgi:hypothetical protein
MSTRRRALVPVLAGALALPALSSPALAAPGDTPIPAPRGITEFCANPTAALFTDVSSSDSELALAVRCLATAGIAQGGPGSLPDDQYGPQQDVTRGQMATFVARLLDEASDREAEQAAVQELPEAGGAYPFPGDARVGEDNATHRESIQRLAQAEIVTGNPNGTGEDRYGPNLPVTRAQMATFLNRAVAFAAGEDPADAGTESGFAAHDAEYYVDELPDVHEPNINGITSVGISNGTGNKRYGAQDSVSRQQMARFLTRTLSALFSEDGERRVLGLLDVFSASFPDGSRATERRLAGAPAPTGEREYTIEGLDDALEYRITLVKEAQVTVDTDTNLVTFAVGMEAANGSPHRLVNTGMPTSTIVEVNGEEPRNNGGVGTANSADPVTASAVARPEDGTITFTVQGEQVEDVLAAFYVNGRGAQASYETGGGLDQRLEIDAQGRPVERFGLSGVTTFMAS